MKASFVVEGQPRPKKRPRFNRYTRRAFTPKQTQDYERHVHLSVWTQMLRQGLIGRWPTDAKRYVMTLRVFFRTAQWADADNVFKAVSDACNGLLYDDDVAVDIGGVSRAQDSKNPRVEIEIVAVAA